MSERPQERSNEPTANDASRILETVIGGVQDVRRFPNGLAHFVFDASLSTNQRVVVRLTRREHREDFAGALYWDKRLRPLGVPLPRLIYAEIDARVHGYPVMILERLPGVDLGDCYPQLTSLEQRAIVTSIVELQRRAATLPTASGYGYATWYQDPGLKSSWLNVIQESLGRSRHWIQSAGVMSDEVVAQVERAAIPFHDYFAEVRPTCFLHDTTTKNVIIHEGKLSGIVDVDSVCFGDPLWVVSLTDMAMRSAGFDGEYVDVWTEMLGLTRQQRRVLDLYTAMHCVAFLGEIGQRFNKAVAPSVDPNRVAHLRHIFRELLAQIE